MATNLNGGSGAPGTDGKTIRSGNSAPATSVGVDGDFYLNTSAVTLYGPKSASAWPSPVTLVGSAGAAGSAGYTTIDYKGAYVSTSTYQPGNFVVHSAQTYIAVASSTNSTPPASSWNSFPFVISGSGDQTFASTYSSRPSASNDGNLFLPTDGLLLDRDNSSTWASWGPVFPFVAPVLGDFTAQNSASASASRGTVFLTIPASGSASLRAMTKAVSGNHIVIAACLPVLLGANTTDTLGLCWSDGTKYVTFGIGYNSGVDGGYYLLVAKWNTTTSFSANYAATGYSQFGSVVFLKVEDDGVNRLCSISSDGINWILVHSVGRTDFLTPSFIGFAGSVTNASNAAGLTLLSWNQS